MKRKRLLALTGSICLILVLASLPFMGACAEPAPPTPAPAPTPPEEEKPTPEAEVITLKHATILPPSHYLSKVDQSFADQVGERTNGRVIIETYFTGALGGMKEVTPLTSTGAIEIGNCSPAYFISEFPLLGFAYRLFGLFATAEEAQRVYLALYEIPAVQEETKKLNLKLLYPHVIPCYYFLSTKPIHTIDDLEGLKIRTFGDYLPKLVSKFGAIPVSVSGSEQYEALGRGAADATASDTVTMVGWSLQEVAKHIPNLRLGAVGFMSPYINLDVWNSLPADVQTIMLQLSKEMAEQELKGWREEQVKAEQTLAEAGVAVFEPVAKGDQERLQAVALELVNEWLEEMKSKGLGEPAAQVIETWKRETGR